MNLQSPSLAELQQAFCRSLFPSATAGDLGGENADATAWYWPTALRQARV